MILGSRSHNQNASVLMLGIYPLKLVSGTKRIHYFDTHFDLNLWRSYLHQHLKNLVSIAKLHVLCCKQVFKVIKMQTV